MLGQGFHYTLYKCIFQRTENVRQFIYDNYVLLIRIQFSQHKNHPSPRLGRVAFFVIAIETFAAFGSLIGLQRTNYSAELHKLSVS